MNITPNTTDGCAAVESGPVEGGPSAETGAGTGATTEGATTTTETSSTSSGETTADETGKAPADEGDESGGKPTRVRPADRLAKLATVEGWLALLAERVADAVEQAIKDDAAFVPPVKPDEIAALATDGLALIVPEVAPKLAALAQACAGARDARLKREAAHRVSCKRIKAAQSKVAKDRAAAEAEAEKLRAKLRSLETALGPAKAAS